MNKKSEEYVKEHLEKERKDILRKRSVENIIQEFSDISEKGRFVLRVVISPEDYPHIYEYLDFDQAEFDTFCNQDLERSFTFENQTIRIFDPQGTKISSSEFLRPIVLEEWMNLRSSKRFSSILIKHDGVLLFFTSQDDVIDDKTLLNLESLSICLRLFLIELIPDIYEKMNYDGKLNVDAQSFGLINSCLKVGEPPDDIKLTRDSPSEYSKSYILHLQKPIIVWEGIITDIRNKFQY